MQVVLSSLTERRKQLEAEVQTAFSTYHFLRGALFEIAELERYAEIPNSADGSRYAEEKLSAELLRIETATKINAQSLSGVQNEVR